MKLWWKRFKPIYGCQWTGGANNCYRPPILSSKSECILSRRHTFCQDGGTAFCQDAHLICQGSRCFRENKSDKPYQRGSAGKNENGIFPTTDSSGGYRLCLSTPKCTTRWLESVPLMTFKKCTTLYIWNCRLQIGGVSLFSANLSLTKYSACPWQNTLTFGWQNRWALTVE